MTLLPLENNWMCVPWISKYNHPFTSWKFFLQSLSLCCNCTPLDVIVKVVLIYWSVMNFFALECNYHSLQYLFHAPYYLSTHSFAKHLNITTSHKFLKLHLFAKPESELVFACGLSSRTCISKSGTQQIQKTWWIFSHSFIYPLIDYLIIYRTYSSLTHQYFLQTLSISSRVLSTLSSSHCFLLL